MSQALPTQLGVSGLLWPARRVSRTTATGPEDTRSRECRGITFYLTIPGSSSVGPSVLERRGRLLRRRRVRIRTKVLITVAA